MHGATKHTYISNAILYFKFSRQYLRTGILQKKRIIHTIKTCRSRATNTWTQNYCENISTIYDHTSMAMQKLTCLSLEQLIRWSHGRNESDVGI